MRLSFSPGIFWSTGMPENKHFEPPKMILGLEDDFFLGGGKGCDFQISC